MRLLRLFAALPFPTLMKFRTAAIVLIVVLAGTLLWLSARKAPPAMLPPPASPQAAEPARPAEVASETDSAAAPAEPAAARADGSLSAPLPSPVLPTPKPISLAAAAELPSSPADGIDVAPVTVLENIRSVFRNYSKRLGGNPVGNNPEITAALNGANPKQIVFLNPDDGLRVNEHGELIDNWNTPLFFHQLSQTEMEIHSAGPDRRMWTADDLVIK